MKPVGETLLEVINPKTKCVHSINFIVVKNSFNCLLVLSTVQTLNLVTVNDDCSFAKVESPTDKFSWDLGFASLTVDPNVSPKILPSRKIPLALQDQVKAELDTLVQRNVISLVDEPTPWVSQMAVVTKPNGDLRICIDPQPLNRALQREHYKLPTIDDILPQLKDAKIFSKLIGT